MGDSSEADRHAVVEVATHYFESWFDGVPDRMREVLHPALAKRSTSGPRPSTLSPNEDTAEGLVVIVGGGPRTGEDAKAAQAEADLPDQVDTEADATVLAEVVIDPQDLLGGLPGRLV